MQCFFCKLVQMSNFGRLKSANGHILDRLFQIWGNSPKSILRIWWALLRSSIPAKNICSPMQCFFCKLVQMSNFGRLKSANGHFWIDYFQIIGKSLTSISRIWWALRRSYIITKRFCSPLQCLFCKLVQMSNFGLNSANEISDRFFQIWGNPQNPSDGYGGYYLRSSIPPKIFALQYSAFSVNWCKCPILVG